MNPNSVYPAHIVIQENGGKLIQTVEEHLRNTAAIASNTGKPYGLEKAAYLLGMVHDAGKFSDEFARYIEKAANNEHVVRGSVNHTFSGVRLIMDHHGKSSSCTMEDAALEILAYAVGAHHGQFDCVTDKGRNEFERRIHEDHPECDESISRYYVEVMDQDALSGLIQEAVGEIIPLLKRCQKMCKSGQQMKFCAGLLARLLLSILIDADRQDTAAFMSGECFPKPFEHEDWESIRNHADAIYSQLVAHAAPSPVNRARQAIASACVNGISQMGDVIRLNIPTGAGKTITSLRAALAIACDRQKAHIIYSAPLLSILEQNANEIRRYVGNDSAVLEHHSNVVATEDHDDIRRSRDLLVQNWSAPVIVTTMVQLLNAMFDGATASIRRFCALGRSVMIIDEVQTVPKKMLTMFNLTISFLSTICQTTLILCSATQPYLERADTPPLVPISDLMPYQDSIWQPFQRTKIIDGNSMQLDEVPAFVEQITSVHNSVLVVCNKKAEAVYLMDTISLPGVHVVHLSASMCTSHRRDVLESIQTLLAGHEKVLCISTQVIEAGVDVSFGCVIRLTAGMDSIVQAAGRCNRHGENPELCPVYVIHCNDEQLVHLPDIQAGKIATMGLLDDFRHNSTRYSDRLESDASIRSYYDRLYQNMPVGSQDMPIQGNAMTMVQLLSDNMRSDKLDGYRQHYYMKQAFDSAGKAFAVLDNSGKTVIVPWKEGQQIIDALQEAYADNLPLIRRLIQQAHPYTVTVYDYQFKQLQNVGGISELLDGTVYALSLQFYDSKIGLCLPDNQFLEV